MRRTGNRPDGTWSPPTARPASPSTDNPTDNFTDRLRPDYVAGPITVIGTDVYDLDRDNDGVACED
jgi:Excalibur calcium-binding domain